MIKRILTTYQLYILLPLFVFLCFCKTTMTQEKEFREEGMLGSVLYYDIKKLYSSAKGLLGEV